MQKPDSIEAYYSRGNILLEMKRYGEALADYRKVIEFNPNLPVVYNTMGYALQQMGQYEEALASCDKAIALKPDYVKAYNNRGIALQALQRYDEALASYAQVIALDPQGAQVPSAYGNRGHLLRKMHRYDEASACYEKAMQCDPHALYLLSDMLHTRMHLADWRGFDAALGTLVKGIEADKPMSPPFSLLALSSSAEQQRKCAENYVKNKVPPGAALWNGEIYSHAKIRVAYVSGDFREHAVSALMAGVFEHHDRARFDIYGISLAPEEKTALGQRAKAGFDRFIDVSQKSDGEAAQLLRDLEIDIAVDLMGFTTDSRPGIFASRCAPAQVNYLGYPATMGADYMDYIIADACVIPPESREHYSEKVVVLPQCFQANDDKRFISNTPPSRATYGLPEEGFVFCAFNNTYKITPAFFDIWMRLLKAIPHSVLWLLGGDTVQRNFRAEAVKRGIEPSRLIFATRMSYANHLARLPAADLFLDTMPFNAGTTASDALWAGLPLLTCTGEAFAARMAGSLLTALKLPELIAENVDDYEARALELATHPEKLSALRKKLIENRQTSALFNTALFTQHLEDAYRQMWRRSQEGLKPDHIYAALATGAGPP